jgi:holliday junction DNA helicase RuvA
MIGYLNGSAIEIVKTNSSRLILILEVNNIGYEIQITKRFSQTLSLDKQNSSQIFTHLQIQEDKQILYGFATSSERDLFRQLISVSGIGTQLAIALLDTLEITDLVTAIVAGNVSILSRTPGVGKKTAERIVLELKTKLAQWHKSSGISLNDSVGVTPPKAGILEDLEMTLLALGYSNEEIYAAIAAISQDSLLSKNPNVEEWIRSAIEWLSVN